MAFLRNLGLIPTVLAAGYTLFLLALTSKWFQAQTVYLHNLQMTPKDLVVPEQFGFLHGQVKVFRIKSFTGLGIFAWHILPLGLSRQLEGRTDRPDHLKLLQDDPEARLVIHFHGAGGTVGSGYRVPNYRALSAAHPSKLHILTFDYGGFGRSPGRPSEETLISDALAICDWALNIAGIGASRILLFSQSLGTAVNLAMAEHFAAQTPPTIFAGHILVAPFVDVPTLVGTYKIAGTIPILSPLARFPTFFAYLQSFIKDKWLSGERISNYVRVNENRGKHYQISILHAEDDWDIPFLNSKLLYWHAINATNPEGIRFDNLEESKMISRASLGEGGTLIDHRTRVGVIQERILKTGLHDVIMGFPIISAEVIRIFSAVDPAFIDH